MYSRIFQITGEGLQQPVEEFVRKHHQQAHESIYPGGLIRLYEDYSFLNGNNLLICIRLDSTEATAGKMCIEFIAGGSREGLINWGDGGTEKRRVSKFHKDLAEFCNIHRYQLAEEKRAI